MPEHPEDQDVPTGGDKKEHSKSASQPFPVANAINNGSTPSARPGMAAPRRYALAGSGSLKCAYGVNVATLNRSG